MTSIEKAVSNAYEKLSQIDIAVSNAGIGVFGAVEELDSSTITKTTGSKFTGFHHADKSVNPFFKKAT